MALVVLLVLTGCSGADGGVARDRAATTTAGGDAADRSHGMISVDDGDEETVAVDDSADDPAPDTDAVLAKVLDRAGDDPAVRECLAVRVPVEPEAAQAIAKGGASADEATVSVVRDCQRLVAVVDGWIGDADRHCVATALSSSPEAVVQAFHSSVVAPEGGAGKAAGVEELSKQLKECGS